MAENEPLDSVLDLDKFEAQATDPEQWYSGGGYRYVELLPEELAAIVAEARMARDRSALADDRQEVAEAHASRLSPPTREELAQALHNAEWDVEPVAQSQHAERYYRLANAILARLSAPEEEWEYGVHHVEAGGDSSMLIHESRESAEKDFATCGMFCDIARRTPEIPAGPWLPVPAPETGTPSFGPSPADNLTIRKAE